ncbi:hypothetical protein [Sphingomonas corticis]|jgi:UPF0716 family protein affecting phage T7 exclusion|uniref:Uncharacterized protein n=1 Tax=Sphingomonas corticis TaxID=2722791 RepID=A0ABX1CQZ6_9SPHN|nr:hypothetical protein [Sphingomonas corticis]NJR80370.1 hypothetical protein [Sphingomonas corticis]
MKPLALLIAILVTCWLTASIGWVGLLMLVLATHMTAAVLRLLFGR